MCLGYFWMFFFFFFLRMTNYLQFDFPFVLWQGFLSVEVSLFFFWFFPGWVTTADLTSASSSVSPTKCMSSFITSWNLLFGLPLPGSTTFTSPPPNHLSLVSLTLSVSRPTLVVSHFMCLLLILSNLEILKKISTSSPLNFSGQEFTFCFLLTSSIHILSGWVSFLFFLVKYLHPSRFSNACSTTSLQMSNIVAYPASSVNQSIIMTGLWAGPWCSLIFKLNPSLRNYFCTLYTHTHTT